MALRDKLEKARFTAEGAGRLAKSKLESSAGEARDRASSVDARRVARKAGRLTQRAIAEAEAQQAARPRDNRDMVQSAGEQAQMGGPLNASLQPLSGPEQTYQIAGGAPQSGQPLDRLAVGGVQRPDGGDRRRQQPAGMMVGVSPMAGMGVGVGQSGSPRDGEDNDGGSSDPLVVDSPFFGGVDDGQR